MRGRVGGMSDQARTPQGSEGARMATFLVESYTSDPSAAIAAARRSARAAAEELSSVGQTVRYRWSIAIPGDQQAFHLFEGSDPSLVREVCRRAGISCDRLVEALSAAP